jgi:prophage DNA circulation protein
MMAMAVNPWRKIISGQPAQFRDVIFHVETGGRSSGRRAVVHEYPKRNDPYTEDMGRHAQRFQFAGYLIYRPSNPVYEYTSQRARLLSALEADDAAILIHPVFAPLPGILCMCERFTMTESRERGGYTQFDMSFVEAGKAVSAFGVRTNAVSNVSATADSADQAAKTEFNNTVTNMTTQEVLE